jgi:acetyltransferase
MLNDTPNLQPLFAPESIAVVGASPDSFYSGNLVNNLLDYGYEGKLYPVNPNREEVWGRTCYDNINEVPEVVDLVVVNVPRDYVVGVIQSAGSIGVPMALVISAGFAEADDHGMVLESKLGSVAKDVGIRVVGPNCIGTMCSRGATLSATCSREPQPGNIALVSQSGALAFTSFFERAADKNVHFSHVVSTGNEVDLTTSDYIEYFANDSTVDVICTYIEGLTDPDRFMKVTEAATQSGTPVLTIKIGQSDTAEAATMSHTGSLTGNDDAWTAAFRQTGVQRVADIPDLLSQASAHSAYDSPSGDRVAIVSTSGGLASLLADQAYERGLSLPEIDGKTEQKLLDMDELLTFGSFHNPADIRGYGADVLPDIADTLFSDNSFDAYVFAIGLSAVDERAERIASDLVKIIEEADDPTFVLWTGRKATDDPHATAPYERLREFVPVYEDPGRCLDAIASLVSAVRDRERLIKKPLRSELSNDVRDSDTNLPDNRVLTWAENVQLLSTFGIPTAHTKLVTSQQEAADAAADIGFPVALKIDSPLLPHRTDVGAVQVGINSNDSARTAFESIMDNATASVSKKDIEGVLVQPMIDAGVEAIVGISSDDVFGPLVSVGPGGVLVEAVDDVAVLVPPFSYQDAYEAIEATSLFELIQKSRGNQKLKVDDFANFVLKIGSLASLTNIAELDLNPVMITQDGPIVVDAFVKTNSKS